MMANENQVPTLHILSNDHVNGKRFAGKMFTSLHWASREYRSCNAEVYWRMKMPGLRLIQPTELYNLINQETKYPCLSDPVFMLLIGELLRSWEALWPNVDEPYSEWTCRRNIFVMHDCICNLTHELCSVQFKLLPSYCPVWTLTRPDNAPIHGVPEKMQNVYAPPFCSRWAVCHSYAVFSKWSEKNCLTTKASVWIRQLNILCFATCKWTFWKQN